MGNVPAISIRRILKHRHVTLLKIDIDSIEGVLLHAVVKMIRLNETQVETILVEMGDNGSPMAWDCRPECASPSQNPRGGHIQDLWQLQHEHGYDLYRVNIITGREIFDWTGANVNVNMVPQMPGLLPMFSVRSMRKLEKIIPMPRASFSEYQQYFHWGTS